MHSFFFAFTFQIHIHIHIFTSEVTCYFCYFCYRLTILLPLKSFFTFLPLNCVPTQPLLHRDAIFRTSRRSHRYVGTQFQMHREGVKNTENPGAIPRDALSDSSNIFLSYSGLLIFCPCVRQQCKM